MGSKIRNEVKKDANQMTLRTVWILNSLLDAQEWTQKDIQKLWYIMAQSDYVRFKSYTITGGTNYYFDNIPIGKNKAQKLYDKYVKKTSRAPPKKKLTEITHIANKHIIKEALKEMDRDLKPKTFNEFIGGGIKRDISNIFNHNLWNEDKGIVKRRIDSTKVKTLKLYFLPCNLETLYSVIKEYKKAPIPGDLRQELLKNLMTSEYLKKIINNCNLLERIESKLRLSLNNEEKRLLDFLLKKAPNVLYNTLEVLNKPEKKQTLIKTNKGEIPLNHLFPENRKRNNNQFIKNIKFWLYEDLEDGFINSSAVNFEISISIKLDENKDPIVHTSPYDIYNAEDNELAIKIRSAQLKGYVNASLGKKLDNDLIKFKEPSEIIDCSSEKSKEKLVKGYEGVGYSTRLREEWIINEVYNTVEDEVFFKHNNKEFDRREWLNPPRRGIAPFGNLYF